MPAYAFGMLSTEYSLRSSHLLFLLLVASSLILGFGYINEMYQRIQLQSDVTLVQRQTQQALSEKSTMRHKAGQLQLKVEAMNNEMQRLQGMHELQAQQQSTAFVNEKNELLEKISLKDEEITDLREQYGSLKVRYDRLHAVMEEVEKNQSRLLEQFTTQSVKCMNVISMMTALCDKGRENFRKILPLMKGKNVFMDAAKNQSQLTVGEPNIQPSIKALEAAAITPSGGTQRSLSDLKIDVKDSKEKTTLLQNIKDKDSTLDIKKNITESVNINSPKEQPKFVPQDGMIKNEQSYAAVRGKGLNEFETVNAENNQQKQLPYASVDTNLQTIKNKSSNLQDNKEGGLVQLTGDSHKINGDRIEVMEKSEDTKQQNNNPLEGKTSDIIVKKIDKELFNKDTLKMNIENALSSQNIIKSDSIKYNGIKENHETLKIDKENAVSSQNSVNNIGSTKAGNTKEEETLQEEIKNVLGSQQDVSNTESNKDRTTIKLTLKGEMQHILNSPNEINITDKNKDSKDIKETLKEQVQNVLSSQNKVPNTESDKEGNTKDTKEVQNVLSSHNEADNIESDKDGNAKGMKETLKEEVPNVLSAHNNVDNTDTDKNGNAKDMKETWKKEQNNYLPEGKNSEIMVKKKDEVQNVVNEPNNVDYAENDNDENIKYMTETLKEEVQNVLNIHNNVDNTENDNDGNVKNAKETLKKEAQNVLSAHKAIDNIKSVKDQNANDKKETLNEKAQNVLSAHKDIDNIKSVKDQNPHDKKETLKEKAQYVLSAENGVDNIESNIDKNAKNMKETFKEDTQNLLSAQKGVHNIE